MPTSISTQEPTKELDLSEKLSQDPESHMLAEEVETPTRESMTPENEDDQHDESNNGTEGGDGYGTPESVRGQKHPMFTPGINKRRQATKHIVVNSPTDNIFSPISRKLLGRKRNDSAKDSSNPYAESQK